MAVLLKETIPEKEQTGRLIWNDHLVRHLETLPFASPQAPILAPGSKLVPVPVDWDGIDVERGR